MCGITGYTGREQAIPMLLQGLSKLEYRGYDSAGIALQTADGLSVIKSKGRLSVLADIIENTDGLTGTTGIGHTRWATHGEPSDVNAHPHQSGSKRFAIVHNGIIENYRALKDKLIKKGFAFQSQTDTEVIAQLLEYYYRGDIIEAVVRMRNKLEGSYSIGIICADLPDRIIAVRKDSPLVVARCEGGSVMASDIPAFLNMTRDYYSVEEKEIVILSPDNIEFLDLNCEPVNKDSFHVDWDADAAEKGGYEHFMIKEIMEQPKAVSDAISPRIKDGAIEFEDFSLTPTQLKGLSRVYIVACGSAYHAGICGSEAIQKLARIPVEVALASEFRYGDPLVDDKTLVIIISQSGETADSLAALRYAKKFGAQTLGVVNVVGSSISREADNVIYINAGPEIAVATTKAYSCQLAVLYLLAIYFAKLLDRIDKSRFAELIAAVQKLPEQIDQTLTEKDDVQYLASKYYGAHDIFFIGRGCDYAAALEASLKLKEISYIHSEAYAAGELKHGPIALIEQGTLVIALACNERLFDKFSSNIEETRARGAHTLGVTWKGNDRINEACEYSLYVPRTEEIFSPSLTIIPMQLFSYYVSAFKGLDIDKPRNLAKSVTVE